MPDFVSRRIYTSIQRTNKEKLITETLKNRCEEEN